MINREQALNRAIFYVDNALDSGLISNVNRKYPKTIPESARLVGFGDSFSLFVACWSYFGSTDGKLDRLSDDEASELACDLLVEKGLIQEGTKPSIII